jgi:hypothetical protein
MGSTPGIGRAAARRSLQQVYAPVAIPRRFIRLMRWVTLGFRPTLLQLTAQRWRGATLTTGGWYSRRRIPSNRPFSCTPGGGRHDTMWWVRLCEPTLRSSCRPTHFTLASRSLIRAWSRRGRFDFLTLGEVRCASITRERGPVAPGRRTRITRGSVVRRCQRGGWREPVQSGRRRDANHHSPTDG